MLAPLSQDIDGCNRASFQLLPGSGDAALCFAGRPVAHLAANRQTWARFSHELPILASRLHCDRYISVTSRTTREAEGGLI